MNRSRFGIQVNGIIIVAVCLFASCSSYKTIPYFQNITSDSAYIYKDGAKIKVADYNEITIQPNDILEVSIQTIDPQLNSVMSAAGSDATTQGITPSSYLPNQAKGNSADIVGYLVDKQGMIELPIAGKIQVGGLTTAQAKEVIRTKAMTYYKEPVVNVRIVNFKVTVLGEVTKPGSYLINGEKATILDALGEAGDMSIFGVRTNVLLSRNEDGHQKVVRFNMNTTDIFESPYFYLRQGDILYVQPSKGKAASNDGAVTRTYALISSTLALVVVVATRINFK